MQTHSKNPYRSFLSVDVDTTFHPLIHHNIFTPKSYDGLHKDMHGFGKKSTTSAQCSHCFLSIFQQKYQIPFLEFDPKTLYK